MSPSLRLTGASFAYDTDRTLLDGVDLHLTTGWTGLVGPNGSGKSTLLRVLAGELSPGTVHLEPTHAVVLRLEQRLDAPDAGVLAFGNAWDTDAVRLGSRLDLPWDGLDRWPTLSPGERRRWQVAAALWRRPDVLLLDEPDNHLDVQARALLVDALRGFEGIGLIVSHDRHLLDALTTRTVRLQDGAVHLHAGPWSEANAAWSAASDKARDALRAARRVQASAHRRAQAAADTHASASRGRSLRHVDPRDHDARSMGSKVRSANAEQSHARSAARLQAAAERATQALDDLERPDDLGRDVFVDYEAPRRRRMLELRASTLRPAPDADVLLRDVDLHLDRGERVWLRGPNGAGKSTLVRALLAVASLPDDRVLVLPQELDAEATSTLIERMRSLPPERLGRVMQRVAALGVAPGVLLRASQPSPGEARKLALALGLGDHAWLLVLDEPTHHLDLPARQRLQAALTAFPGAVLLVSHDQALARAVCDQAWTLTEGRLQVEPIVS